MSLAAIAIGSLLLGQAAPPPPAAAPVEHSLLRSVSPNSEPPALAAPPPATSPVQAAAPARANPAAIVGQALALPADSALTGRPIHLLSLLSLTQDRRRQLELTHAYWRLVEAVANYSFCLQENHRAERFPSVGEGAADLRAARDSLAASREEAAAQAIMAQHELAALMSLPADAALPLPADSPHVGLYNTYFREIFAAAEPPPRLRLLDRLLPLRVRAIDAEAAAAQAAEDAAEAVRESPSGGKASLAAVAAALEELRRRQEALVAAVCRYNHDIADYALNVARPGVSSTDLTAMLIRWPQGDLSLPAADRKVVPASANEPVPTWRRPLEANQPTRAVRPPLQRAPAEPQFQPPAAGTAPATPGGKQEPTPAAPRGAVPPPAQPATDAPPPDKLVPLEPEESPPIKRQANKPVRGDDGDVAEAAATSPPLYAALARSSAASQAKELAAVLCRLGANGNGMSATQKVTVPFSSDQASLGARNRDSPQRRAMSLAECLRIVPPERRLSTVEAYWTAQQRLAECQAWAPEESWLEELKPLVLPRDPNAAVAMLQLREARLAAAAARAEANLAWIEAQAALAGQIGAAAEETWPLPRSLPLIDDQLPGEPKEAGATTPSWAVRRCKAAVPLLAQSLRSRAAAIVETDVARAAAGRAYGDGKQPLPETLAAVHRQTAQTLAFLQTLGECNRLRARWALAVLPPTSSADDVAAALVAEP